VVYGCKGDLHFDLLTKIPEYCAVNVLHVVDCDVSGNTVAIDDVLPKELFDG
jgi:hypothetical protein